MKQTIDKYDFRRAFLDIRPDQFSLVGLDVLFEYLEQMEQDTGEEMTLDVIALCYDYYESDYLEIAQDYDVDLSDCEDDQEKIEAVRKYLEDNTCLVGETSIGAFIYQAF